MHALRAGNRTPTATTEAIRAVGRHRFVPRDPPASGKMQEAWLVRGFSSRALAARSHRVYVYLNYALFPWALERTDKFRRKILRKI